MTGTYYDLLDVSPDASTEEVERAYRERLKETHPDVSDAADARDRTRRLIEARNVLADASERARYDRLSHESYVDRDDTAAEWAGQADGHPTADAPGAADSSTDSGGPQADRQASERERRGSTASGGQEQPGSDGDLGDTRGDSGVDGTSRREQPSEHVGTPSWSGHREAQAGAARAWNPDSPYAVHRSEEGLHGSPLSPVGPSLVLLAATFLAYPVLVAGVVFPQFPLVARVLVGGCALGVVAYLQSAPEVGLVVFGTWSVLGPAVLVALGVPLVSVPGAVVTFGTCVPLGLSALVWFAIR